jgi:hypothetical protein
VSETSGEPAAAHRGLLARGFTEPAHVRWNARRTAPDVFSDRVWPTAVVVSE